MKEIRSKLRDTITDCTDSLTNKLSLSSELTVFLNLLLFGNCCDDFGILLPVKAIFQIILWNIKSRVENNLTSTHQRHNMDRESPFLVSICLKAYSQVWYNEIWNPFENDEKYFLFYFKSSVRFHEI